MCSIINPHNQLNKVNIKSINCNNKYNESYITKLQNKCMDIVNKFYKSQNREETYERQKLNKVIKPKSSLVNPSQGGQVTGPSTNPSQGGQVTGPSTNPSQGGQVTGPRKNPLHSGQGTDPRDRFFHSGQNSNSTSISGLDNMEIRTPRNPTKIKPKKTFKDRRNKVHK